MSTTIAEVEVESISVDQPNCNRPCCRPKYFVRVLGKDVEVSHEIFERVNREMKKEEREFYLDKPSMYRRRYSPVFVKLVIE